MCPLAGSHTLACMPCDPVVPPSTPAWPRPLPATGVARDPKVAADGAAPTMDPPRAHPIVRANRIARAIGMPSVVPIIFLVLHAQGRARPQLVTLLLMWGFLWPQCAYLLARRSSDSKLAEHRNLLWDSVMVGAWAAGMHFSLWPTVVLLMSVNLSNLAVGGVRLALWGCLGVAVGMLAGGMATGFAQNLPAPLLPTAAAIAGIFVTSSWIAYRAFLQGRQFVEQRRLLQEQKQQVEDQSEQLAKARDTSLQAPPTRRAACCRSWPIRASA